MMCKYLLIIIICGLNLVIFAQTDQKLMKKISIGLNARGDISIAKSKTKHKKLPDITVSTSRDREPVYGVPIGKSDKLLTIKVSGTKENAKGDLGMTGDGFVVRVLGIELSNGKILNINLQTAGNKIEYLSNKAEENPSFSFAVDPTVATEPSYSFKLKRTKLLAKKKITVSLDIKNGTINFADNDTKGSYSLEITKINADGSEDNFSNSEISSKKANLFHVDFKNWSKICLRNNDNGKGFGAENCKPILTDKAN